MHTKFTAWALASAFICAPLSAQAAQSASASISGLQFVLSDLTPNDEVTASLTRPSELQLEGWNSTAGALIQNHDWQQAANFQNGIGAIGDTSASAVFGSSSAQASLAGSGSLLGPYNISASGTLVDIPSGDYLTTDYSSLNARAGTDDAMATSFLLSAHTSVTLSGQADLFISTSGANPDVLLPINTWVSGKFLVRFAGSGGAGSQYADSASKELIMGYTEGPSTDAFSQTFSFTYVNDSDRSAIVDLWANASVYAMLPHLPASAVPEPGSQALMVLGLLGLLGLKRRH